MSSPRSTPRYQVPHRAELFLGAVVLVVVLVFDLRSAIGFSSFAVLVYYAIANGAALTLHTTGDRSPTAVAIVGILGCLILAATLPTASVLLGLAILLFGLISRAVMTHRRPSRP